MGFEVRTATNSDSQAIIDLIVNIWTQECGFKVKPEDYADLFDIENSYLAQQDNFLVATIDNKIKGTIASSKLDDMIFVLKRMFVATKFRGAGVAAMLLDNLLTKLPLGSKLFLSTKGDKAQRAIAFYQKNDFFEVDKNSLPDNFPIFLHDDVFMCKTITQKA